MSKSISSSDGTLGVNITQEEANNEITTSNSNDNVDQLPTQEECQITTDRSSDIVFPEIINLNNVNFEHFASKVPDAFGPENKSPFAFEADVLSGKKELMMMSLHHCWKEYYSDNKLLYLAELRHDIEDSKNIEVNIRNCSFYVTVGVKEAYDRSLQKSTNKTTSASPKHIHLKTNSTYQDLFRDFFFRKFESDESSHLDDSFDTDQVITVALFARSGTKTAQRGLVRYLDQLVAAASFPYDTFDSVLLTWLAVVEKSLNDLNIHPSLNNDLRNVQLNFNIGTLMIIMCQTIMSLLKRKWVPVLCQCHKTISRGPYGFYAKNFFQKMPSTFQLCYQQLCERPEYIIEDDSDLIWMVLLYPLQDLLMIPLQGSTEWNSYQLILVRGYYYFLRRQMSPLDQKKIGIIVSQSLSDVDIIKIIDNNPNNDISESVLQSVFTVFNSSMNKSEEEKDEQLFPLDCGNGINKEDSDSLFLSLSLLLYGDRTKHLNLRQFIYFYYRSLSLLSADHPILKSNYMNNLISNALQRLYKNNVPTKYININVKDIDGAIAKDILWELSQKIKNSKFGGDYQDITILSVVFKYNVTICDVKVIEGDSQSAVIKYQISKYSTANRIDFINKCIDMGSQPLSTLFLIKLMDIESNIYYYPILSTEQEYDYGNLTFLPDNTGTYSSIEEQEFNDVIPIPPTPVGKISTETALANYIVTNSKKSIKKQYNKYYSQDMRKKYLANRGSNKLPGFGSDIGQMFSLDDFVNAQVDPMFIMPILRSLDPYAILVEHGIYPIEGVCTFLDLIHYRPNTWMSDSSTCAFVNYIQSIDETRIYIDPGSYNNNIRNIRNIIKILNDKGIDDSLQKDIIMMIHLKDHFIVAEIQRSKTIHGNKTPIAIADSLYSTIESLSSDMIQQRYFKIFLGILGIKDYEYTKAEFVRVQDHKCANDCGVICLQRMYALATYGNPSYENLPTYLQSTTNFRCHMLYKIFEFNRNKISQYVMYHVQEQLHFDTDIIDKDSMDTNFAETIQEDSSHRNHKDSSHTNLNILSETIEKLLETNEKSLPVITQIEETVPRATTISSVSQQNQKDIVSDVNLPDKKSDDDPQRVEYENETPLIEDDNKRVEVEETKDEDEETKDEETKDEDEETKSENEDTKDEDEPVEKAAAFVVAGKDDDESVHDLSVQSSEQEDEEGNEYKQEGYSGDTDTESDNYSSRKRKNIIKIQIPSDVRSLRTRPNKLSSPKRVSARIQERVKDQIELDNYIKQLYPTAEREFIQPSKKRKDPQNFVIGSKTKKSSKLKVRKVPKTQDQLDKKLLSKMKITEIEKKEKMYDEFTDAFDFDDPNTDPCFLDDLYTNEPYYFVDKQLEHLDHNLTDKEKHQPEKFVSLLYNECQYNEDIAKIIVEQDLLPNYENAKTLEDEKKKKYETLLKKTKDVKSKKLQLAWKEYAAATIQRKIAKFELDGQVIFLPYNSIFALQPVTKNNSITEYIAVTKNQSGTGYQKKLVSKEFVEEAFDNEFIEQVDKHESQKGWVVFDKAIVKEDEALMNKLRNFD
jgi:hypothetical protein